eukprot:gene4090-20269_t
MKAAEPEITFVSELEVIVDFMGDQNYFDDNEDFEKEPAVDISLEDEPAPDHSLRCTDFKRVYKTRRGLEKHTEICNKKKNPVDQQILVVTKANIWLPDLKEATAVQLAMQYGEKMVHNAHTPAVSDDIVVCATSLTSKESH